MVAAASRCCQHGARDGDVLHGPTASLHTTPPTRAISINGSEQCLQLLLYCSTVTLTTGGRTSSAGSAAQRAFGTTRGSICCNCRHLSSTEPDAGVRTAVRGTTDLHVGICCLVKATEVFGANLQAACNDLQPSHRPKFLAGCSDVFIHSMLTQA